MGEQATVWRYPSVASYMADDSILALGSFNSGGIAAVQIARWFKWRGFPLAPGEACFLSVYLRSAKDGEGGRVIFRPKAFALATGLPLRAVFVKDGRDSHGFWRAVSLGSGATRYGSAQNSRLGDHVARESVACGAFRRRPWGDYFAWWDVGRVIFGRGFAYRRPSEAGS